MELLASTDVDWQYRIAGHQATAGIGELRFVV
jgi:hypothetical protein